MATEQPKPATVDVKMDLFEDDDEFEEFDIDQGELTFINFSFYFYFSRDDYLCLGI